MNPHDLVYNALAKGATSSIAVGSMTGLGQKRCNDLINQDIELYKMLVDNRKAAKVRKAKRITEGYASALASGMKSHEAAESVGVKKRQVYEYRRYLRELTGQTC